MTSVAFSLAEFTTLSLQDVLEKLGTKADGLSAQEAENRLQRNGKNTLKGNQVAWYHILLRQLTSPFLYLLVLAAGVSFFLHEQIDGYMILLFVGVNTLLGFYQEYKSEKTLALLNQYVLAKATVLRDGKQVQIPSSDLVTGDVVLLAPGDIIPSDLRMLKTESLSIDESVLTGESVPVLKEEAALQKEAKENYQAKNIVFSGTSVFSGRGWGVVIATGLKTAIGQIATLTSGTKHTSTFEKGVNKLSSFILKVIVLTIIGMVLANVLLKGESANIPTLVVFAIALAISVIPEALPVVMTFSLSRGALHLAKNKVVVKRLSAIEDLGSIEVLCTDKTGTLTENTLTLMDCFPRKTDDLLMHGALTTVKDTTLSQDPFDTAFFAALPHSLLENVSSYHEVSDVPFTPVRLRNSVLWSHGNSYLLIVRGAWEALLPLCKISISLKGEAMEWMKKEENEGRRVIAVASRKLAKKPAVLESEEKELKFLGIFSFEDPLKKTASAAIAKAERLGVAIKILTGDSRDVAGVVALKTGLIKDRGEVMIGAEFDELSSLQQRQAVERCNVFARVSPVQKHAIVGLLRERYEVGFLGEGINDAPALKAANVAIVVQSASGIAREAADIILLHKSLRVVVDGIHEGREIFGNTAKYIKATLASNFGNFYTVAISSLFIPFLPLLPLQILFINLLTDFPMIAVVTDTVDPQELKRPKNYDVKEIALFAVVMGAVSTVFDFLFFVMFYKISPGVLQTNWFIGSVLTELVFLFAIRTKLPVWRAKFASKPLVVLSIVAFLIATLLPFSAFGRDVFFFVTPTGQHIAIILLITLSYFVVTECVKQMYYRFVSNKPDPILPVFTAPVASVRKDD